MSETSEMNNHLMIYFIIGAICGGLIIYQFMVSTIINNKDYEISRITNNYNTCNSAYNGCTFSKLEATIQTLDSTNDDGLSACSLIMYGDSSALRCNYNKLCEEQTDTICKSAGWVPRPAEFAKNVELTYNGMCMFCNNGFCGTIPNCNASIPIIFGNETFNYTVKTRD